MVDARPNGGEFCRDEQLDRMGGNKKDGTVLDCIPSSISYATMLPLTPISVAVLWVDACLYHLRDSLFGCTATERSLRFGNRLCWSKLGAALPGVLETSGA